MTSRRATRRSLAAAGALLAAAAATAPAAAATPAPAGAPEAVIVRGVPGAGAQVARAVVAVGGHVGSPLTLIDGVAATVPAGAVRALAAMPGVAEVSPDATMRPLTITSSPSNGYSDTDEGSPAFIHQLVGSTAAVAAGYDGKGVDVALIDTGVAPVPGLDSGNVVNGPDLSLDSQNPGTAHLDGYGHGTFMAGLIAAGGSDSPNGYTGVAPGARIINVKVGAADGSVDVSQVIAALGWVAGHAHDPGMNIKVVNLSYGTDSNQAFTADPLAYAAEVAWHRGVVVVAAGGNDGVNVPQLADPAYDPYILAVGADDPNGTLSTTDDLVPSFATHGTQSRKVDVIAPAVHVVGLRVPGSYVDTAVNTGKVGTAFQLGSGTSQAAAITSGVLAQLAENYPSATPDDLRQLLLSTATSVTGGSQVNASYRGHGIVNAGKAVNQTVKPNSAPAGGSALGNGSLELSRGSFHLVDPAGVKLSGEQDIFGDKYADTSWAGPSYTGSLWSGGTFDGATWSGSGWSAGTWQGATWTVPLWDGASWNSSGWSSGGWSNGTWRSAAWSNGTWRNVDFSTGGWSNGTWRDAGWSDAAWG